MASYYASGYGGAGYQSPSYGAYGAPGQLSSNMASPAQAYGSVGSFSGRKPMQPPGGHSSISIGDGSGYSAYSRYGAYQPVSSAPSNSPYSGGGQYGGAAAYQSSAAAYSGYTPGLYQTSTDLSSQLNLPQQAMRRPPSSGRRAGSVPSAYDSPSANYASTSAAANPYGGAYGSSTSYAPQQTYTYGAGSNAYGAGYGQSTSYGAGGYGAAKAPAYSSPYSAGYGSAQGAGDAYGGGYGGGAGAGGYGAVASGYGAGSLSSPTGQGQRSGGGYYPSAGYTPSFQPGQKGQFCGKIIMQPPGGKTSINIFG